MASLVEYAPKGNRINAVCPAFVWTRMVADKLKNNNTVKKFVEVVVLIKRMAEGQEAGDIAVWLCGLQSTYFNGVSMTMDAGALLNIRVGQYNGRKTLEVAVH